MLQSFSLTETLAFFIGLYMLAAGIGLLINRNDANSVMEEFKRSPGLGMIAGMMAFAIGCTLIALHNRWDGVLESVVSIVGWAALIEGVLILAIRRQFVAALSGIPLNTTAMLIFGLFTTALGAGLLFGALS